MVLAASGRMEIIPGTPMTTEILDVRLHSYPLINDYIALHFVVKYTSFY